MIRPSVRRACAAVVARLVVAAALASAATPLALAAGFAELTVTAYGAQRFDLATGFTELVDGGEVVDRGTAVRLVAPWLRYAEGRTIEARDATVEGPFGSLRAPVVHVDLSLGRLVASDGVVLEDGVGTLLSADSIVYDARVGWAVARGDVVGAAPTFVASAVWADLASGRIVLEGPYGYEDGLVRLRSASAAARLQLTPIPGEGGSADGYDASTTLDDDVVERLEAGVE